MCVAFPGKVLSCDGSHARVDFSGSVVNVNISLVSVEPGDYVLVHAGMAIQKVEREEAENWIDLFREIGEAGQEAEERSPEERYNGMEPDAGTGKGERP